MSQISGDSSHNHRCSVHGKRAYGYFVRPDANEGFLAFYCCPQKPTETGIPADGKITREQAMILREPCSIVVIEEASYEEAFEDDPTDLRGPGGDL